MDIEIENHPLEPFLPANARLLMLGSFPPQKKRWSMDFYYPNLNNDMWRIVGLLFFNNKDYFLNFMIPLQLFAVYRTMPQTSSWKWCSPLI